MHYNTVYRNNTITNEVHESMNIQPNGELKFLNIGKYGGMYTDTADFSDNPRPFFSIGMILNGKGDFCEQKSDPVHVDPGDMIIVPDAARYLSHWSGSPVISYITFHFILEESFGGNISIQKVCGLEHLTKDFIFAYDNFSTAQRPFKVLSIFYNLLDEVIPKIQRNSEKQIRTSVKKAIDYITFHYKENIAIQELAAIANLSASRFFTVFKEETGVTPIEYKNRICIKNAEKMLLTSDLSIEEIAEKLGFNSSAYFRRTFKAFTGQSPREYKNNIKTGLKI